MFSFFKKSKKEPDSSSNRESKDKRSKEREIKTNECVTPQTRLIDEMCKNKTVEICENANTPSGGTIGVDTGPKDIAFQQLTSDNLVNNDIESKSNEPIHRSREANQKEYPKGGILNINTGSEVMFSYTGSPKRSPDVGGSVKPCGHATVAVAPKIPPQVKNLTPPNTPAPDFLEKLKKKKNGDTSPNEQFFDAYDVDDV